MGTTDALMDAFGPWLPWLFGVGVILLVAYLLVRALGAVFDSFTSNLPGT